MTSVNLSSRIPFVNLDDGTLTPEAYRSLSEILNRTGGILGNSGGDTFVSNDFSSTEAQQSAGGDITGDTFGQADAQAMSEMTQQPESAQAMSEMVLQPTNEGISVPSGALLGGSAGALQSVSVGAGLSLLGGTLSTTGGSTITATAGTAIGGHRAVVLDASGDAFYADNTNPDHLVRFYGITTGAASTGGTLSIAQTGVIVEPSWAWTAFMPVYLGTTGLLTQTPPTTGFVQIVGAALSATTLFINQRDPVVII